MKAILLAVLSLPALAMVGCSNLVNPPIAGRADPYPRQQVHFDSDELRRDTAVGTPIAVHNDSGLLSVTVPIRSAINKTLYIDCGVTFFDKNGVAIEHFGPITKTFDPNTPDQVQFTSTSRQAADFQVNFRYAR